MIVTAHDQVCAIFDDPRFEVPPAPPAADGVAWVRATVSRFSNGPVHARRRALFLGQLDRLHPHDLRVAARSAAEKTADKRDIPVAVLFACLGIDVSAWPQAIADARTVSAVYPLEGDHGDEADAAADRLVALLGPNRDESTAARVAFFAQAATATATLIDRALELLQTRPECPVDELLTATLAQNSPVATTKRVGPDGETVVLDLAGTHLPFGHGQRACPGREHALALAAGVLDTTLPRTRPPAAN